VRQAQGAFRGSPRPIERHRALCHRLRRYATSSAPSPWLPQFRSSPSELARSLRLPIHVLNRDMPLLPKVRPTRLPGISTTAC
jgi:hypothetical protein